MVNTLILLNVINLGKLITLSLIMIDVIIKMPKALSVSLDYLAGDTEVLIKDKKCSITRSLGKS